MSAPDRQSSNIPGLVMWPNGHIVRVQLDKNGAILRDKNGRPEVLEAFGRSVLGELDEAVFRVVEAHAVNRPLRSWFR